MTTESELAAIKTDLRGAAYARQRDSNGIRDDLVQEGLLMAWEALQQGQTPALAKWRARQRMDVLVGPQRREKWTGHTHTGPKDPMRQPSNILALEVLARDQWTEDPQPDLDVRSAIRRLPLRHREIVYRKFWLGETYDEIGHAMRLHKQTVFNAWANSIRPRLRIELQHLCNTPLGGFDVVSSVGKDSAAVGGAGPRPGLGNIPGREQTPAPPGGRDVPPTVYRRVA